MAKKQKIKPMSERNAKALRTYRHFFMLNDKENKALDRYICKYKIKNKSKFIRETLMFAVIKRMEEDTPTLFDDVIN
ncbi:conserved hypothetical protein [uncultured Paludibacter sp.]|nr:conserved hypothetical protein [uncultured Paludibacter sp.]